ncbi:MAG: hypothetical protein M1304_01475 [Candidatus Thermoplasmatota archaeon]|nr:hypothetical protein [Candidatus Thermoplasmatota archaeon]
MDSKALGLYYGSMIVYMIGSIPLILYTLIVRPIANMYHEPISQMVSPIFGNYGAYLRDLFIISLVFVTVSVVLYLISVQRTSWGRKGISLPTIIMPVILFAFAYILLGVAGI